MAENKKNTWKLTDKDITVLLEAIKQVDVNKLDKDTVILLQSLKTRFEISLNN